jgi:molybdopterin adenylyltransferase
VKAAIVTVSTSRALGSPAPDESGRLLAGLVQRLGGELAGHDLIPDDRRMIEDRLCHWTDGERCDLVLTTGGTGMAPSDVTPEATRNVIEREAPGIAHAMLDASRPHTPHWMLSRAVAGTRGSCLIVNLPGSPKAVEQCSAAIERALPHALELLAGTTRGERRDLNPRPPGPQPGALPTELRPPSR